MIAPGLNVLLVDDDEVDVMNLRRVFARNGLVHRVSVVGDGVEALELLYREGHRPRRVVLLDLNMPRMGGIELLRRIRSDPQLRKTAVVVMTTSEDERDKTEAHRLDVAGYMLKPIGIGALEELMGTLDRQWTGEAPEIAPSGQRPSADEQDG